MPTLKQNVTALGSSIAALSAATSAVANGYVEPAAAPYVPVTSSESPFVGFYMGASLSLFDGEVPTNTNDPYQFVGGAVGGAFFGFNHAMNDTFLIGAELNLFGPQQIQEVGSSNDNYTMNVLLEARARAGYLVNDSLLAYGFLGVSTGSRTACCSGRTYSLYGHNVGLGAEYMLSDEFSIGAEVSLRSLNSYDDHDNPQGGSGAVTLRAAFHF